MFAAAQVSASKPSFSLARVFAMLVPAILVLCGVYLVKSREWQQSANESVPEILFNMGLNSSKVLKLDARYTDADADLVADAPQSESEILDPEKLVFCFVTADTSDSESNAWSQLVDFVSQRLGKPTEIVTFTTASEETQAMADGKVHVGRFNTGNVPAAVNAGGFVPFCTIGHDDGKIASNYCQLQIIVNADSSIRTLADLKGTRVYVHQPWFELRIQSGAGCCEIAVCCRCATTTCGTPARKMFRSKESAKENMKQRQSPANGCNAPSPGARLTWPSFA